MLLMAVLGALALSSSPRVARVIFRRRRWAAATGPAQVAEAAWAELRDTTLDLRLPWTGSTTLRQQARNLVAEFGAPGAGEYLTYDRGQSRGPSAAPEAARALERLVTDVERARYGSAVSSTIGRPAEEVAGDVALCRAALEAGSTKATRRRARWLPRSLVKNGWWRTSWRAGPQLSSPGGSPGVDTAT